MKKRVLSFVLAAVMVLSMAVTGGAPRAQAAANTKKGAAADVVAVAKSQVGNTAGKYQKWGKCNAWCAAFASWCLNEAGAGFLGAKNTASCDALYKKVMASGGQEVPNPQPGDLAFYVSHNKGKDYCHVSIVIGTDKDGAITVHGNTDSKTNKVRERSSRWTYLDTKNRTCEVVYVRPNYTQNKTETPLFDLSQTYYLVNQGKYLDIAGNSGSKSDARVQPGKSAKNQQFKITFLRYTSTPWYIISPVSNSKVVLNPFSDKPAAGDNVNVYTSNTSDITQGWFFEAVGEYVVIRSCANRDAVLAVGKNGSAELAKYKEGDKNQLWAVTGMDGKNVLAKEIDIMAAFEAEMESLLGSIWRDKLTDSQKEELNNSTGKSEEDMMDLAKKFFQQIQDQVNADKTNNGGTVPDEPKEPEEPDNGGGDDSHTVTYRFLCPDESRTYNLVNKASGRVLDVLGDVNSSKNKSNVQIYDAIAGNRSQQFQVTSAGVSNNCASYSISPVSNSGLAVNPDADAPKSGINVNVFTQNTADSSQCWIFEPTDDGDLIVRNAYNPDVVLTAEGTKNQSNVQAATYTGSDYQLWSLVPAETAAPAPAVVSGTTYTVANKASGKVLDVLGDVNKSKSKANIQVYSAISGNKSQQFTITDTGNGWYSMSPRSGSGMAVNPDADAPKNGTNVNLFKTYPKDSSQGWVFEAVGDYFIIRNAYNRNVVLTAAGGKDQSNVKVATYKSGDDYQLWSLTPVG